MTSVVIMGTPVSSSNRGVLALCSSLVGLCLDQYPDAKIHLLLSHDRHETVQLRPRGTPFDVAVLPARLSLRSRFRDHLAFMWLVAMLYRLIPISAFRTWLLRLVPTLGIVKQADLVGDIRGGDSFSDIYGMRRFIHGFFMAWMVILIRGELTQFPQTYGPYKSSVARFLARFLLRRSSKIIARDKQSQRVAQDLAGPGKSVLLSPDVAFSLQPIFPEKIHLDPPLDDSDDLIHDPQSTIRNRNIIGLNVNGLMYNGGYTRNNMFGLKLDYPAFLRELVTRLLDKHQGELWLIPHTYGRPGSVESDPDAALQVRGHLPPALQSRVRLVEPMYDQHEIKAIIGSCDFFVGSRMHACIAALSQGVPCVGVAYSMKFHGVFESVGLEDWVVEGRSSNNQSALAATLACFAKRDEVREQLGAKAEAARRQLDKVFDHSSVEL